jgi:Icc-related predicted phosphoesterase
MAFENIGRKKQGLSEIEYPPREEKKAFMEAYDSTINLIKYLSKFAPVYTIFGNVESSNHETRKKSKEIGLPLPFLYDSLNALHGVRVVNNVLTNFEGVRIGGLKYFIDTGWVREFRPSDFRDKMALAKKQTDKARKVLQGFNDLDILVCHQPPYGYLDKVTSKFAPKSYQGKHAGSPTILKYIQSRQPKYVFCGHIHEGEGMKRIGKTEVYNLGVANYKIVEI